MSEPTPTRKVARPRNPYIGFGFAASWLLAAAFGAAVLVLDGERLLFGEVYGTRTRSFALTISPISAAIATIAIVRAAIAMGPWNKYVARTTPQQRRALTDTKFSPRPFTPLLWTGVAVAVGWLVVFVFMVVNSSSASAAGLFAMLTIETLFAMVWITLICVGLRGNAAHRRRTTAAEPIDRPESTMGSAPHRRAAPGTDSILRVEGANDHQ